MATDHRPSLNIPSPGRRWFNPTMDRSGAGQCPGQMHCRRQTAAKRGWLQNRGGGMEPLALFLLPLPPVESVGGALSRGHVTSSRFSFRREWPLSAKFASILVESWSILSERGETTRMIYVAWPNREFEARDAGHFLGSMLFRDFLCCCLSLVYLLFFIIFFSIVRLILFTGYGIDCEFHGQLDFSARFRFYRDFGLLLLCAWRIFALSFQNSKRFRRY